MRVQFSTSKNETNACEKRAKVTTAEGESRLKVNFTRNCLKNDEHQVLGDNIGTAMTKKSGRPF